jgi:LPXTG-site transpeptidase (sortase) family protein
VTNKLSLVLLLVSLITFATAGFFVWQRLIPVPRPSLASQPQIASVSASLLISIPDLKLSDIPVYEGELRGTVWEYSTIGISHLSSTPWAGQQGNAVYYGHNWPNLLGNLHLIKVGQTVVVTTSSGSKLNFKVTQIETVSPDQIRVIAPSGDTRLTLFTCTGFMDLQRLVVTAR